MSDQNISDHQPGTQRAYQIEGMEYYVYLPPGDPPPGGWPILLFTHGIGEATHTYSPKTGWTTKLLEDIKVHGSPPLLCDEKPPEAQKLLDSFIVISPQFPFTPNEQQKAKGERSWLWTDRIDTLSHILESAIKNFKGNPQKIYATGFSRGGRGALALAQQLKTHQIAKLVLVDSEIAPKEPPGTPTWVHYAGPHTFGNIVQEHQSVIGKLGQGQWASATPGAALPAGQHLFTDWGLKSENSVENHTKTSRLAYSDPRVYEWLLQEQSQPVT